MQVLKKFIGVEDNLGKEEDARGKLQGMLQQILDALKGLPETADYRRAVEATTAYRLKVLEANDSDAAVEEVLDSHMEELILECKEELRLIPLMTGAPRRRSRAAQGQGQQGSARCVVPAAARRQRRRRRRARRMRA